MKSLRLYKKEKLCSNTAINLLFDRVHTTDNHGALAYPLRAVWRISADRKSDSPIAFLISVPKRRIRHAVDRVTMRRRIREAYRLCHHNYKLPENIRIDVAFIYIANILTDYKTIDVAVNKLLNNIHSKLNS